MPFVYTNWIAVNERAGELRARCAGALNEWQWQPRFAILLHSDGAYSAEQLDRSTRSVARQIYPKWTVAGSAEDPIALRITSANADFIVPLRVGDELSIGALFQLAVAAQTSPAASILYGDEDRLDARGRRVRPWFKPSWNEELFFALDYVSSAAAIRQGLAVALTQTNQLKDVSVLILAAAAARDGPVIHVPHILTHRQADHAVEANRVETVAAHLQSLGASCRPGHFGTVKVVWPLPDDLPLVTIIIPTRDKVGLLQPCVEGVLERTEYPNFEILVIDNGSVEPRTAEYLAELAKKPQVRIKSYPQPYNFSAINNFGVEDARGSYVCLLNNDTQVIEPCWLTELMRYAIRPEVGAAGAKLLYEDGSIQHAGVVIGIGTAAGHAHRFLPTGEPGYFRMPHAAQFVSAVTAACLVVEKRKFEAIGGLDPEFAVAFNDVDFCLKLQRAGWRNVYVPHAVLLHYESKSRGSDMDPRHVARFRRELELLQRRWGTAAYVDPLHNPNLDRFSETFVLTV